MRLERPFAFTLAAPEGEAEVLLRMPERVFRDLPGLKDLRRENEFLLGRLCGEAFLFGEFCFPFKSRLVAGEGVRLSPLPLEGEFWAELEGVGEAKGGRLVYRGRLVLHARLPEGEKWGGRAFKRMVEAALERTLKRALAALPEAPRPE